MADRNVSDCCPELQALIPQFIEKCASVGITVKPIVTWRSATDQNDAKAKGLSRAGAGSSPHNYINQAGLPCSLAFDFGVFAPQYVQDGTDERYTRAGAIGKGLGMVWGGDFHSFPDPDHFEIADWKSYSA